MALLENVAKGDQVEDMPDDVKIVGFHSKHNIRNTSAVAQSIVVFVFSVTATINQKKNSALFIETCL